MPLTPGCKEPGHSASLMLGTIWESPPVVGAARLRQLRKSSFSTATPPWAWTPPSAGERQSARLLRIGLKPNEQADQALPRGTTIGSAAALRRRGIRGTMRPVRTGVATVSPAS